MVSYYSVIKSNPEYLQKERERVRNINNTKYSQNEEYRLKKIEYQRQYRLRKKLHSSSEELPSSLTSSSDELSSTSSSSSSL